MVKKAEKAASRTASENTTTSDTLAEVCTSTESIQQYPIGRSAYPASPFTAVE